MKLFVSSLKTSFFALLLLTLLLGVLYPLFLWGVGQAFFHKKANGSLLFDHGKEVIGSVWIGQNFSAPNYFHPRPSSAGSSGYNASSSSGSNLGPTSQKLIDAVTERAAAYRAENGLGPDATLPGDAVTGSGSGLDPHISVENARLQAQRVAAARRVGVSDVEKLIERHREGRTLGFLGEPRVNVLRLNLALDQTAFEEAP